MAKNNTKIKRHNYNKVDMLELYRWFVSNAKDKFNAYGERLQKKRRVAYKELWKEVKSSKKELNKVKKAFLESDKQQIGKFIDKNADKKEIVRKKTKREIFEEKRANGEQSVGVVDIVEDVINNPEVSDILQGVKDKLDQVIWWDIERNIDDLFNSGVLDGVRVFVLDQEGFYEEINSTNWDDKIKDLKDWGDETTRNGDTDSTDCFIQIIVVGNAIVVTLSPLAHTFNEKWFKEKYEIEEKPTKQPIITFKSKEERQQYENVLRLKTELALETMRRKRAEYELKKYMDKFGKIL